MSKWYYLLKGKAQGPVTENQIRELLREHQLTLNDIVFREGESKWKRISEFTDTNFAQEAVGETNLQQLIKLPNKGEKNDPNKWVVLLKIQTDTEIKFVQKGSWTTEEVKDAIQRGEVSYADHVWKSGFTKWERIGDLEEFSFKGETQILSLSTPATPKLKLTDDILKPRLEITSTATRQALKDNPIPDDKTSIISQTQTNDNVMPTDFSEKTSMAFSLKLDKNRISDLINKASQEADKAQSQQSKFDEKTVIESDPGIKIQKVQPLTTAKIPENISPEVKIKTTIKMNDLPGATGTIPKVVPLPSPVSALGATGTTKAQFQKTANLVFDDEDENRKEPSIWLATNKTRSQVMTSKTKTKASSRSRKKKFWNSVFQLTQVILVVVIISLIAATFQNLKKRQKKAEAGSAVESSSGPKPVAPTAAKPKKRKPSSEEPIVAETPAPAQQPVEAKEVAAVPAQELAPTPVEELPEPPNIIEEFVELASKPPANEKNLAPLKPRTSTPFVKIKALEINSKAPKLRFSSNANEGEAIKISIRGLTGEVLQKPSFSLERSLTRRRGKEPEINLRDLGVTAGYYTIEAEMAGAKSILNHIFVGPKKNFESLARDYRKEVAHRQQWEKKSLVRISGDTGALTKELFEKYQEMESPKEWQEFFTDWRRRLKESDSAEMRSINSRNQNEYAYPDVWLDLKILRQKVAAEADEMNSAFLSSRRTASSPNRKLLDEANQLANRAGDLSGWRQKSIK